MTNDAPLQSADFIEQGTVSVYDVAGQLLVKSTIVSTNILLDEHSLLPNGVYFIKVNADGVEFVEKVVICR